MPARTPASDDSFKRERAGTYRTRDGRFTIAGSSSGWLLLDAEQTDELGLPLARGPFPTLDAAKAAIEPARTAPAPVSGLLTRAARPVRVGRPARAAQSGRTTPTARRTTPTTPIATRVPAVPPKARPAVVIREIRAVDGDALRALWTEAGFRLLGDDDLGLARLARRNPGLVLVASEGSRVVGSALGTWDGHRGWIYHVTTAASHRRQGIATRLIDQIEAGLRALGCRKVNLMVRDDSDGGPEFWAARGYEPTKSVQFGKELDAD